MTSHAQYAVADLGQNAEKNGYGDYKTFSDAEINKLRPVAETLAMLDGNAFFGLKANEDDDIAWKQYIPEAKALYEANGGDLGWAGQASFTSKQEGAEKILEILRDPNAVHQNMLRGLVAVPSREQMDHIRGFDILTGADAENALQGWVDGSVLNDDIVNTIHFGDEHPDVNNENGAGTDMSPSHSDTEMFRGYAMQDSEATLADFDFLTQEDPKSFVPYEEYMRLLTALHDAIQRPMGVVPNSAEEFYDPRRCNGTTFRRTYTPSIPLS